MSSSSLLKLTDLITQNVLVHPFITLRRTCQVNRKCSPFICIQPFSLMSFMYHQQRKQGIAALYKGLSSELLVKGMTLGTVTALACYLDWPTEIAPKSFLEDSVKLSIIKGASVAIITPFLCSSVIETVQSVIVVKDRPAFIDCLKEGFFRLLQVKSTPSSRIIPIWLLVLPTVFYHVGHSTLKYIFENSIDLFKTNMYKTSRKSTSYSTSTYKRSHNYSIDQANERPNMEHNPKRHLDITKTFDQHSLDSSDIDNPNNIEIDSNKISSSIIASLLADVTLLPVETIINRLYIQGTRTIIDNCDETTVVLPVLTNYEGFSDCYQSVLRFEGNLGLFKGLGAIVLQYTVHYLIFRSLYFLLREFQVNLVDESNQRLRSISRNNRTPKLDLTLGSSANTNSKPNDAEYMRLIHQQNTFHSTPNIIPAGMGGPTNYRRQRFTMDDDDNYGLSGSPTMSQMDSSGLLYLSTNKTK